MASLFTTAGLALMAQRRQTEDPVVIDRVQIGSLTPAQRYDATVGQAALVDPISAHGHGQRALMVAGAGAGAVRY